MTNIIKFPLVDSQSDKNTPVIQAKRSGFAMNAVLVTFWRALLRTVWVVTVLIWPFLKWAISIYIFFLLLQMVGSWDKPGSYAGWTFIFNFAGFVALNYFVSIFKPKGL